MSHSAQWPVDAAGVDADDRSRPAQAGERWSGAGGGKRGGARVIYFFHNETLPVFLLALYGKNEKANLSKAERNAMAKLVPALIHGYSKGRGTK